MYRKAFELARSLLILYLMLYLGGLVAHYVPIGIPSSIWGLLLLFTCLILRIVKVEWVIFSSRLLIQCGDRQIFRLAHGSNERIVVAEYCQYLRYLGCNRFTF